MVESGNWRPIESKRKAITTLLPYALRKERDGQPKIFDAFMRAVRASKDQDFTWRGVRQYASRIPHETSPRATVLILPHIRWGWLTTREDLIRQWATATFTVSWTEEVVQSAVDTLLQIASQEDLISHIPAGAWSWLAARPSLPPICRGRDVGTRGHVVRAVRALNNIETLKSYFLLVWSQWSHFSSSSFGDRVVIRVPALAEPYTPVSIPYPPLSNSSDHWSGLGPRTSHDTG